ncbi:MAG: 4Fe-4S binding protein [Bacteroidales bacterium]|nr:4Fe-4S binding protein [Bacteroidales bacterium]MDT8431751.1 4Fe-4S binding protein [Bacteroidales bacterium]
MKREIIHIDEELCDGCGECIPNCHEGALQLIDGKARLISDLMCDGLGACIGHCPQGAITMETREAEPYNETLVIQQMAAKGKNTVIAHLRHLLDHDEFDLIKEGVTWMKHHPDALDFKVEEIISVIHPEKTRKEAISIAAMAPAAQPATGGCPGSMTREIKREEFPVQSEPARMDQSSQLKQWPVQFHLVNPAAGYFHGADLLLAADCSAYTLGNFHSTYLKGKSLVIACPKLDSNQEIYLQKLVRLIDESRINTIHVLVMEVPCCGGLLRLVQQALQMAERKVPVKATVVSIGGEVLSEDWI